MRPHTPYQGLWCVLLIICCHLSGQCQKPDFEWISHAGGADDDTGLDVILNAEGGVIVTGYFIGESTFGSTTFESRGGQDIVAATVGPTGEMEWAVATGGPSNDEGRAIALDSSGNLIVAGHFRETADLFGDLVQSMGGADIFVVKLDPQGGLIWSQQLGGPGNDFANSVAVDSADNILLGGSFEDSLTSSTEILTSMGKSDALLAKWNAFGELQWMRGSGGGNRDEANAISVDSSGHVCMTGSFRESATFQTTEITSLGSSDLFVSNYDSSGDLLWVNSAGGNVTDVGRSIAFSPTGDCYVSGYFSQEARFDNTIATSQGGWDIFVAKYDPNGALQWLRSAGGSTSDIGHDLAVDSGGDVIVSGYFLSDGKFGNQILETFGNSDLVLVKYSSDGDVVWVTQSGGTAYTEAIALDVGAHDKIVTTGYYRGPTTFGSFTVPNAGGRDLFVTTLTDPLVGSSSPLPNLDPRWLVRAGSSNDEFVGDVAVDKDGNSFITGFYLSETQFGPLTLQTNNQGNIFLAKYDAAGRPVWAKQAGGDYDEQGRALALDSIGNVYLTGDFHGGSLFDNQFLQGRGSSDIFLAKYDGAGTLLWVAHAGGEGNESGTAIAVDAAENCYLAGVYNGHPQFEEFALPHRGLSDLFVAKYDPDGTLLWVSSFGGPLAESPNDLAVNSSGEVFMTGYFFDQLDFGQSTLMGAGSTDFFLVKFDTNGTLHWTASGGGPGADAGNALAIDPFGNILVAGAAGGDATFGGETITTAGSTDILLLKYSTIGDLIWVRTVGGSSSDSAKAIAIDPNGTIWITGSVKEQASIGEAEVFGGENGSVLIAGFDSEGNVTALTTAAPTSRSRATGIFVDQDSLTVVGTYRDGDFELDDRVLENQGRRDLFLARFELPTAKPRLDIETGSELTVRWTTGPLSYRLESTRSLSHPIVWTTVPTNPSDSALIVTPTNTEGFFRLIRID